jgi:hypothetical protein
MAPISGTIIVYQSGYLTCHGRTTHQPTTQSAIAMVPAISERSLAELGLHFRLDLVLARLQVTHAR